MLVLASALMFSVYGGLLARGRKGKPADIAQYATAFGILGALVGFLLTILVGRFF
ncbi:MAG: apolipoprotein acyltransferase [Shimia sp.]